jgi:hypothetical protein
MLVKYAESKAKKLLIAVATGVPIAMSQMTVSNKSSMYARRGDL